MAELDPLVEELKKEAADEGVPPVIVNKLISCGISSLKMVQQLDDETMAELKFLRPQERCLRTFMESLNARTREATRDTGIQIQNTKMHVDGTGKGSEAGLVRVEGISGKDLQSGVNLNKLDVNWKNLGENSEMFILQWNASLPPNAPAIPADFDLKKLNQDWDLTDGPTDVKVELCTTDFFETHKDGAYSMKRGSRGKALIINVFEVVEYEPRWGTNIDRDKMDALLQQLHFQVTVYNDSDGLSVQEIHTKLTAFAADVNKDETEASVVCLFSHGKKEGILSTDGNIVAYENIFRTFDNRNCKKLIGKPKLFIFQACRRDEPDFGVVRDHSDGPLQVDIVPTRSDMFMWYPTQESYAAFRVSQTGSWFIEAIVKVFMKYAKNEEISAMSYLVHHAVCSKVGLSPAGYKQAPECRQSLCKKLYFFPGIQM